MRFERGIGYLGIMLISAALILVVVGGMKLVPAYLEYYAVKKAVAGITSSGELRDASVLDVQKAFDRRRDIDSIEVISGKDLEISKNGTEIVVAFSYAKKIRMFANVSVCIDFEGSSNPSSTATKE